MWRWAMVLVFLLPILVAQMPREAEAQTGPTYTAQVLNFVVTDTKVDFDVKITRSSYWTSPPPYIVATYLHDLNWTWNTEKWAKDCTLSQANPSCTVHRSHTFPSNKIGTQAHVSVDLRDGVGGWGARIKFFDKAGSVVLTPSNPPTPTPTPVPPTPTPTPTPPPTGNCLGVPAYAEQRPQNTAANQTVMARDPDDYADTWPDETQTPSYHNTYYSKVNGECQGTTQQILEWIARKWFTNASAIGLTDVSDATFASQVGVSGVKVTDWFKAQAIEESNWVQAKEGDFNQQTGQFDSFGLLQVRRPWWPMAYESRGATALSVDIAASIMRSYYDGVTYLTSTHNNPRNVVGAWVSGEDGQGGNGYTNLWVQRLQSKPWNQSGF